MLNQPDEATTLLITLYDNIIDSKIILSYTIFENMPVITRNAYTENCGEQKITLEQVMSMSLDLPDKEYEMIELTGAWARERSIEERKLRAWNSIYIFYSKRMFK